MTRLAPPSLLLALAMVCAGAACDADDGGRDHAFRNDDPALADYDDLVAGTPTNDELPFDIKADGPPPRQHASLVELQSPVKSQGKRGVCSIFSTVGLMEHLYIAAGADVPDFSEQYLQWSAKFEVGSFPDSSGSNAFYNLRAINEFGIPAEAAWPYEITQWDEFDDPECVEDNEDKPTRCYTNGAPPQQALDAEKFHLPPGRFINSRRASIMDHIRVEETGVIVGLDFFYQSWNHRKSTLPRNLDNWDTGIVLAPNEQDIIESHEQRAGHSIVIVGWDLDLEFPRRDPEGNVVVDENGDPVMEQGFWIFKNSWGTEGFGIEHPNGPGYGYLSMEYVDEHGRARASGVPDLGLPPPDDGDDDDDGDDTEGQTFRSDEVVEIPDDDDAGITSTITVDAQGQVAALTVEVDIEHTWRGDLVVRLTHAGHSAVLHDRSGGGQANLSLQLEPGGFEGHDKAGEWTLEIADTAGADVGRLRTWAVTLR